MVLDLDMFLKLASLASFAISCGAMVVAFFATRSKGVDERFKAGSDQMKQHELRISGLEQSVQGLPSKDALHELRLELVRHTGHLEKMEAVIEGNAQIMKRLENIVTRHEDHLLGSVK